MRPKFLRLYPFSQFLSQLGRSRLTQTKLLNRGARRRVVSVALGFSLLSMRGSRVAAQQFPD